MKNNLPVPVAAGVVVAVVAVAGFFLYRAIRGYEPGPATPAELHTPVPMAKPDFSKMTPEQARGMYSGGGRPAKK